MTPIIIFGCAVLRGGIPSPTLRSRVEYAAAFGATLSDAMFLPTGGIGRNGPSEASVMARLLRETGVSERKIRLEESGTDTLSSVRAIATMIKGETGPVYVATSGFHQPRCVALLRIAGFDARRTPAPPSAKRFLNRWYWRLREVPALPYDAGLLMLDRLMRRG